MRLKEPLQGLKMIQGHVVMHLAMFTASFTVSQKSYHASPVKIDIDDDEVFGF